MDFQFIKTAIEDYKVGAITKSSKYATEKVLSHMQQDCAHVIEYGAGDGIITGKILERLPPHGKLLAIETNKTFVDVLHKTFSDPRVTVIHDDVAHAKKIVKELLPSGADFIVSGIPFSFIKPEIRRSIVRDTHESLAVGGRFVVYQYSTLMLPILKRHFTSVDVSFEPRNIPPYFVMKALK